VMLADPMTKDPSVGYSNFRNNPLFNSGGPSKDDIKQGPPIGDCYFMTLMAAVAKVNPDHARQLVCDLGDGTYAVDFKDNSNHDVYVRVDGDLPTSGGSLVYARLGGGNAMWVPIIEKAWTFFRNEQPAGQGAGPNAGQGTYASIEYWHQEYTHTPYSALKVTASETVVSTLSGGTQLLTQIKNAMDAGQAVWFSGPHPLDSTTPHNDTTHHSFAHAYLVDWVSADHSQIRLRNPYATQGPGGDGYVTISASQAFYCGYNFTTMEV